jgi:hypothetical protein
MSDFAINVEKGVEVQKRKLESFISNYSTIWGKKNKLGIDQNMRTH